MPGKPGRPRKYPEPVQESRPAPIREPHPADASPEAAAAILKFARPIEVDLTQARALAQEPALNDPFAPEIAIPRFLQDQAKEQPQEPQGREAGRQAREDTRQGEGRTERKPLGVPEQRLQAKVPPGMKGRWINDDPGRIERAREGGYEFISSDGEVIQNREGCRSEIVGASREGGAKRGFLMAIPQTLYDQDQRAKAARIDDSEAAIKRGVPQEAAAQDRGAFYTPDEGINLRTNVSSER